VELKEKYGAWLILDEAHATGIFGVKLCGLAEAIGIADRVEIQMGTLSKALGASGGFIAGKRALIDFLVNSARSFIFSTAPVPAAAAAAAASVQILRSPEGAAISQKLWGNIERFGSILGNATGSVILPTSPILPWVLGTEDTAMNTATALRDLGIYAPAIRYPTVPRGKARLRFSVSARHEPTDFQALAEALAKLLHPPAP
jgi:7-keto-8-aminopelargonate synthetase-like enzyme